MTATQRTLEWSYRYHERLRILCGTGEPSAEERDMAKRQADEDLERIDNENQTD